MAVVERLRCRSPNSIYTNQCYSIDIAGFTVAAPDILEEVVILGDGARGAPVGLAGAVLEPQLLNQRGLGFVQGKGEGIRQLGKRLDAARQVGVQGTTTALPAVGSIVRHGGQVGVLAQQHIAQAVDHGKLGAAARLNRLGKVGKLRFHLFAVGAYLRGVAYGGTAAAWRGPSCGEVNGSCSMSRPAMWTASTRVYHFYDAFAHVIGSEECEEGKIFIEPQGMCVMAGIGVDTGEAVTALQSVKDKLDTKYGIVLLQPAYTKYHLELGEISSYPPGYKENAGIFCHNNPWVSIAETVLGRGDRAFEIYRKTCPAYIEDISEIHRTEPYVYSQMVAGKDAKFYGEAKNSWLTGTAAWTFVNLSQAILGVQPSYDGLSIDPCIPEGFGDFTLTRRFRGATYYFDVKNPNNVEKGVAYLEVDGRHVDGNVVPVEDGKTEYHVTVHME